MTMPAFPDPPSVDPGSGDRSLDPTSESAPVQPWGFWATVGWSVILGVLFIVMQTLGVIGVILQRSRLDPEGALGVLQTLEGDGTLISVATVLSSLTGIGAIWGIAALRRRGGPQSYLQLNAPDPRQLIQWLGITVGAILAMDGLKGIWGIEIVPQFSIDIYSTAGSLPLLYLAVVIWAPLYEEMMFRGFLFQGLRHSWLGSVGALWVTALIWAAIHTQYDLLNISTIVLFGVLLGMAQLRTQSLVIPIAMHALNNLISMLQAAWKISILN